MDMLKDPALTACFQTGNKFEDRQKTHMARNIRNYLTQFVMKNKI